LSDTLLGAAESVFGKPICGRRRSITPLHGRDFVVEDEALRLYTVEILTDLGYSEMAASNAAAALEIIGRDLLVATSLC
jgi:hypothetical protein